MIDSFLDAMDTVTVAVSLDAPSDDSLVKIGARLASRLGKNLCLLHVVEPWSTQPAARILGQKSPLWNAVVGLDLELTERATRALRSLAEKAGCPNAKLLVTTGKARARVGEDALDAGSCLLVIGLGDNLARHLPRALSTALTLMATTPVPLLAVDPNKHKDFPSPTTRLLVADDLSAKGEAAVRTAAILAARLGKTWVHQVHVNAMTKDVVEAGIFAASAAAHTQLPEGVAAADIHGTLIRQLDQALECRMEPFLEGLAAVGSSYTREIVEGPTQTELKGAMDSMRPDILVLGRHRSVHEPRTGLARIATRALLNSEAGVLIVPDL